ALRLKVQEAELATGLAEEDAGSTVAAAVNPGNEEFGRAAESIVDTQLEGRIRSIGDQLVLQVSVARQNSSRCGSIDRNVLTGAELRPVIMRASEAVTHGSVMFTEEAERLRCVQVE